MVQQRLGDRRPARPERRFRPVRRLVLAACASTAVAALTLPDVEPRPHQFVYQKDVNGSESWMSADGTRDSLSQGAGGAEKHVFPGCRDGSGGGSAVEQVAIVDEVGQRP